MVRWHLCVLLCIGSTIPSDACGAAIDDLQVTVRRGTGDLWITNTSDTTFNITAYSIRFPTPNLQASDWRPISGRLDASGDGSVDADDNWTIISPPPPPPFPPSDDLTEGVFTGDGGFLQPGDRVHLGAVWNPSTLPLVQFQVLDQSQNLMSLPVTYLPAGDYNEDGVVDAADFTVWRDQLGQTGFGLLADGNGNQVIDQGDFDVWRATFGETSFVIQPPQFAALTAVQVPEPAAAVLVLLAAALLAGVRYYSLHGSDLFTGLESPLRDGPGRRTPDAGTHG